MAERALTEDEKQERLAAAQRLVEEINEAEKDDIELSWRPWVVQRRGDPRG